MSVWLPLLSACNLYRLTPLFFCQFFSLDIARYVRLSQMLALEG